MQAMAKARRRPDPKEESGGPRKIIAQLKASAAFAAWFLNLLKHVRLPAPIVLEHALIEYARSHGFTDPPPER